jgi:hypothetical protein
MQTSLDFTPRPPSVSEGTAAGWQRGSATSREAAEHVQRTLNVRQARVLRLIRDAGAEGRAAFEVADACGGPFHVWAPRVTELKLAGLIVPTARRRENPATGRKATVWRAAC